jgi:hypothetical protein
MDGEQGAKNDATVGVRGGCERGGGLVLPLVGRYGRWGKIVFGDKGKRKAPANSPRYPPYPYGFPDHSSYLNGIEWHP